jgi:hypothetical protein
MTLNRNQTVLLALVVFVAVIMFESTSFGDGDQWLCQNGNWVAKGNPKDPKPIFDCKTSSNIKSGISYDVYCESDSDCGCGGHIAKIKCFIGNKRYISQNSQCKTLCAEGIKIQCVKNQCKQAK